MDPTTAGGAVLAALGLAGAAGLNAWVPLLAAAIAHRAGTIELADPYRELATTPGIAVIAVCGATDFIGDKIPAVDHVLHAIGTVVSPVAGAVLAAGQAGADIPEVVLLVAGATTAGGIHFGRAAVRPLSTTLTGGLGNPVLSIFEDAGSLTLAILAVLAPVVAAVLVVCAAVALALGVRELRRRRRAR